MQNSFVNDFPLSDRAEEQVEAEPVQSGPVELDLSVLEQVGGGAVAGPNGTW